MAKYVSFQGIKNGTVDLSQYKVLWFYYDRNDAFQLPADSQDPDVLNAIKNWYKAGGNLYLAGYANQYLWDLGRITAQYNRVSGGGGKRRSRARRHRAAACWQAPAPRCW